MSRLSGMTLCALLQILALNHSLYAEPFTYVTLTEHDEFTIPEGKTALVVFVAGDNGTGTYLTYARPGAPEVRMVMGSTTPSRGGSPAGGAHGNPSPASPLPLVGPATLKPFVDPVAGFIRTPGYVIGLKIIDTQQPAPSPATPNGTPSTAVVIPEDAAGPVQVVLESSTDLVNWVAANPGTYGSTATNRFFRVRAIQKQAN